MKRKHFSIIAIIILIIILIIAKCNCRTQTKMAVRFVNPPIPAADIPYTDYTVDAAKGDTLMYASGSVLLFPKDAFVDKNGKVVQGKVDIKYREFSNPADHFLSGIPMGYDSAGVHYTFESAGMCDIQAFKEGQPVFVNKKNKPVINIATSNNDPAQNLYFLDTVTRQWINRGKSEILQIGKNENVADVPSTASINFTKPVKPSLMDNELPIIKVTIDPESFEELKAYNNLQFQLDKTEKRFKAEDSYITWDDIRLKKGNNNGVYTIMFSKKNGDNEKVVEYKVRPVLSEKDYAKAMKIFNKQMAQYEKKVEDRKASYKANREAYVKDSMRNSLIDKENEKTAQLNKIIEAKKIEMDRQNAKIAAENKIIEDQNKMNRANYERLRKEKAEEERNFSTFMENIYMSNEVIRNFEIDGFGIWNCDKPMPTETFTTVESTFTNNEGKEIEVYSANLIVKNLNGLYQLSGNKVEIPRNQQNMIVGISEGRFCYITYDEFQKLNITPETKKQNFPLQVVSQENNNYDFIKSIVKQ